MRHKIFIKLSLLFLLTFVIVLLYACTKTVDFIQDDIESTAVIDGKTFYINQQGKAKETLLKGVNLGATIPGYFPGELAITKETYLNWFQLIDEMNANVIRIYTTMNPVFYDALYEYNLDKDEPLYILQGVWINETTIQELKDAYANDREIIEEFIQDSLDLVDIFHGT